MKDQQTGLEAKTLQHKFSNMGTQLLGSQKRAFGRLLQLMQLPSVEAVSRSTGYDLGDSEIGCGCSGCNVCIIGGTGAGKTLLIKTLVSFFSATPESMR